MKSILVASVLIVLAGSFATYLRYDERMPEQLPEFARITVEQAGYTGRDHRFSDESYEVLQADTSLLRQYATPEGDLFWLFLAYFESQKYGSQIHSPKHCLPGGGWKIYSLEPFDLELTDGTHKYINRMIVSEGGQREVMFYWYETRGGSVRNEFGLKWDLMINSLFLRPTDAAIVRFHTPVATGESDTEAAERLVQHIRVFMKDIDNALPFERQKT